MKPTPLHPRLPLPRWKVTHKWGELLDTDNALAWDVAGPLFEAGIKQVAILNRIDDVRTEFSTRRDSHLLALLLQGEMGIRTDDKTAWLEVAELASVPATRRSSQPAGETARSVTSTSPLRMTSGGTA